MTKIAIVHFQPLEKYPPVMNLIRVLAERKSDDQVIDVFTTEGDGGKQLLTAAGIRIHRLWRWNTQWSRSQRLRHYFSFHRKTLRLLLREKAAKVLYFETLSAGAPCLYQQLKGHQCELYIHYHEYTSPAEYQSGMFIGRWLHQLERKFYTQAKWISHTNAYRMDLFRRDLGGKALPSERILPNFPPQHWGAASGSADVGHQRTAFVYVGALSVETMYVQSFAEYVQQRPMDCFWDIYSDNITPATRTYIESLQAENIRFLGGVEYDRLPAILPRYQIGVILYKGHIENYIFNAPNKLFEYLACGLDVWFPKEMIGCKPYITEGVFPAVAEVNFAQLADHLALPARVNPANRKVVNKFVCEEATLELVNQLLNLK